MKTLLLIVGITGVLAAVNAGTRADAAETHSHKHIFQTPGPAGDCTVQQDEACMASCEAKGCDVSICGLVPNCQCFHDNGTRC
jgi:hypothetical protein